MNLVLDIGNTRTKLGLFEGKNLREQAIWQRWTLEELSAWAQERAVRQMMLSAVAEPVPNLLEKLKPAFGVFQLDTETRLPFENKYETPHTLGKDRLAAVAGAQALFPEQNCLVIDCGTCIKYDFMDAHGVYHGGNIAPGARMRIQAMHHFTARLPEVDMEMPAKYCGKSTTTALQNGALLGALLEMEGFAGRFRSDFFDLQLILSGGDAAFFYPYLGKWSAHLEPFLTLYGLNALLQFNLKK